jgi:lipid A ethanolaminephosphotransferase
MDSYGVVIDDTMIDNLVKTDVAESLDLLSFKLVLYLFFFGILPSIYIYQAKINYQPFTTELFSGFKRIIISLLIAIAVALPCSSFYASFIREHKPLRYYTNPTYYIYSAIKYINEQFKVDGDAPMAALGLDAHIPKSDTDRELIVLVVGETARADRFSLNGYGRKTNPYLEKEQVISFSEFYSCGTSTAVSVPCMFSHLPRSDFSNAKARQTENLLDVLKHAGVNVLWRDNNSDSKGVALRVDYQSFKDEQNNTICDEECRDVGMLVGLKEYIDQHKKGDVFIVLHQMGNHGPAYYKRYPKSFERFKPTCQTNQLEDCTVEEIGNTYDNVILYTDYFLSEVIKFLKLNSKEFETAMFYISDHGESLGENGLYLHGLPYMMAPDNQIHVPAVMWFGDGFKVNEAQVASRRAEKYSHDNIFHTVLGFMEIETESYNKQLDILNQ